MNLNKVSDFFDHSLATPFVYIDGAICLLISLLCVVIVNILHTEAEKVPCKVRNSAHRADFLLNTSIFLLSIVMFLKGVERVAWKDAVTVVGLTRDALLLGIGVLWTALLNKKVRSLEKAGASSSETPISNTNERT